ncbi:MAG TPA: ATP-binding cassette domain-containing protein, partial [Candidatus Hodarchaeales archaeon]|nr:ATP-binding cassette domain-containing protein [Candidatus Hodarchaeales archaeon]
MNDIKESEYILVAEDIHKNFEGLVALDGASVSVKKGGLIALIGPNGSGKTTLFNVITGWTAKTEPRNPEREGIPSDV